MTTLLKSATIIDAFSPYHNQQKDILITDGIIVKIDNNINTKKEYQVVELENLHISSGWFDTSVSFGEPGYEERETIKNGLNVAAKSGFTTVAVNPNTNPVIDNKSAVEFLINKANGFATNLYPIANLTQQNKSVEMAELYDMQQSGAIAFGDYKKPITNDNLLKIALLYAQNFNGLVLSFPKNNSIAGEGVAHEGKNSTLLGLKGIPALAEELQISRDLFLLEYTGGKLHIPTISSATSVELIRNAKKKKLDVTCSVAIHNLYFTDEALTDFNTHYKVSPPLRTKDDIEALIEGLKDGTIDMITSDHNPIDIEQKKIEFDYAAYGTIGLESAFGALQNIFTTKKTIELLNKGKSRFGIENTPINIGKAVNITLFNPDTKYSFSVNDIVSKSKNGIFENETLKGKAYGIISNNKVSLN